MLFYPPGCSAFSCVCVLVVLPRCPLRWLLGAAPGVLLPAAEAGLSRWPPCLAGGRAEPELPAHQKHLEESGVVLLIVVFAAL